MIVDDDLGLLRCLIDELIGARHQFIKVETKQEKDSSDWGEFSPRNSFLTFVVELRDACHCVGIAVEHGGAKQLTRPLDVLPLALV